MFDIAGPLPQKYCLWFYALTIISFLVLIILVISCIYTLFKNRDLKMVWPLLLACISQIVLYLQNRLFYQMCAHSI